MSGVEKKVLEASASLPIKDWYATPIVNGCVLTNAIELVRTPEKDAVISLFENDEKCDVAQMSDFEYLRTIVALSPKLVGTREGERIGEELILLQEKSEDLLPKKSDDSLQNVWDGVRGFLLNCGGDYDALLALFGVEKLYRGYKQEGAFSRVEKYNDVEGTIAATCDFRGLSFVRPDPYHARLAEQKKRDGEVLSTNETALLACQAIYDLCADARDRAIEIRLLVDSLETAVDVVAYLRRLKAHGRVWVAADGTLAHGALMALCAESDASLTVRPEIVLGQTDSAVNFKQRLSLLASVYPISLWHFGGVLTQSPLFVAGHRMARRVICDLVCELVTDPAAANEIVTPIFS